MDLVVLIHNDGAGNPSLSGPGHFVRMSDNPNMHAINQTHDGGQFPDADCAVACTISAMLDRGIHVGAIQIEQEDHTTWSGTLTVNVVNGLLDAGIACHETAGTPPGGLWVMNPAWGGLIAPSGEAPYLAASWGQMIVIDAPEPWHGSLEDDMRQFNWVTAAGTPHRAYIEDDSNLYVIRGPGAGATPAARLWVGADKNFGVSGLEYDGVQHLVIRSINPQANPGRKIEFTQFGDDINFTKVVLPG